MYTNLSCMYTLLSIQVYIFIWSCIYNKVHKWHILSLSLQHCSWASYQIAEQVTTFNLVALRGLRVWRCCFKYWLRINMTVNIQSRGIVTFYMFYHWASISEVKLMLPCVQHVFNNSRKQFLFLISDALFNRYWSMTVPGRCPVSHILWQCLFPHWLIKSYLTFWNGDVTNDIMSAWHMVCTTIHLNVYTCKHTNKSGEDITSLSRVIWGIRTNMIKFEP